MTLGIVKRSEDDLAGWLATEAGFIKGLCTYDGEPIDLEPYQLEFLRNRGRFRWVTKSRQVGFSFLMALEALARCHLRENHTSVFVSYNLDDAKEKVLLARPARVPEAPRRRLEDRARVRIERRPSEALAHPVGPLEGAPRGRRATSTSTSSRTT